MFTPPPAVPVPASAVVAGPVLADHRMVWAESTPGALVVRVQERGGRVHRVARFPNPSPDLAAERYSVSVPAFAVRGKQIALTREVFQYYTIPPCVAPAGYACVSPVPGPRRILEEYDRGTFGHVQEADGTSRCPIPNALGFTVAGIVTQRCRTIRLGRRVLAKSALVGAAGPWVAWKSRHGSSVIVRRVDGRHGGYAAEVPPISTSGLGARGQLATAFAVAGTSPCGGHTIPGVELATPKQPELGPLISYVTTPAPFGSALAVSHVTGDCPPRYEPAVVSANGTLTPIGPVTASQIGPLAMDGEEVAVREDDGLHRYARP